MTAINIFVHQDRVHILSDGAFCHYDGTVSAVAPKIATLPHLPAVVAARGPAFVPHFLGVRLMDAAASFDDLVGIVVDRTRSSVELDAPLFRMHPAGDRFELFLAGWSSSRRRAEAYTLASFEMCDRKAWTLHDIGPGIVSPMDQLVADRIGELELNLLSADFDPATDGLALLEGQRASRIPITGTDNAAHVVGGFAMLTTVRRDAIESRVLHTWPDRIGEKIAPAAARVAA